MTRLIRIGSRKSRLANVQSLFVKSQIEKLQGYRCEIVHFETKGDKILDLALPSIGDKGLFTRELEEKLLDGSIDIAVHSLKDLPTELPQGLALKAVCAREDPRDAFLSPDGLTLGDIPANSVIATGSMRRRVQIMRRRKDLTIKDLRGNVTTRIEKMRKNNYRGIVLAYAGLKRLGLQNLASHIFDIEEMIPAAGQGALGIEARAQTPDLASLFDSLNCERTSLETETERRILNELGGSCQVPIGISASITGKNVRIAAFVSDPEAGRFICEKTAGNVASLEPLTRKIIKNLVKRGALEIIEQADKSNEP